MAIPDRTQLLSDLQTLVRKLEQELQSRVDSPTLPEIGEALRREYDRARKAERTAQSWSEWVADYQTQVAAAWVLAAVFARFLEDNGLVSPPRLAGSGADCQRSQDEHERYFRQHPSHTDREYVLWVFDGLAQLPGTGALFGDRNPLRDIPTWLSGDGAMEMLRFFQAIDPSTGALLRDFRDPTWDTRFLGDLYQDLSETARKKYALLQTPAFIEQFILDRTLDPAIATFGLGTVRLIDPACGSGHFLLGAFHRLLDRWQRQEPGTNVRVLAQRSLDAVHGVDVNPFAVAIARFRLLLAAMQASHITTLANAPDFTLHLACGDSLLHGEGSQLVLGTWAPLGHHFHSEDVAVLNRLLQPGRYHAVVANPPYIVPKDRALNQAYRQRYTTCYRQYSLAVPFMERLFELAAADGFVGQITANSFMKREFGKKLIESFFPKTDLTHVIDTSGAYIPGHGTPTVILLGRHRLPVAATIRTVMGIRGEPTTPQDPSRGLVWSAILQQVDVEGSESAFVSVADSAREVFHKHPWSIGGGGAAELKEAIDICPAKLIDAVDEIGIASWAGIDEVVVCDLASIRRRNWEGETIKFFVTGDIIRDWSMLPEEAASAPYNLQGKLLDTLAIPNCIKSWWVYKSHLQERILIGGKTVGQESMPYYTWVRWIHQRYQSNFRIVFAFVATHNHFVLDRGGKVFNRSAPIIKLPASATEDDHLALLGLLNSSTACFWMKQVFFPKGGDHVGSEGARIRKTWWDERYEFAGTGLQELPIPIPKKRPLKRARKLNRFAEMLKERSISETLKKDVFDIQDKLEINRLAWYGMLSQMISLQEELDWECYQLYRLLDRDMTYPQEPPPIRLGERAFEIHMARQMAAGELETTWFDRHRSTPITELPAHWSEDYKQLVERRIELIATDKNIGLIEQPEYKRRWNTEPWKSQLERALQQWLLDRLESYFDLDGRMNPSGTPTARLPEPAIVSIVKLADFARQDADFMQVAALYRQDTTASFDLLALVAELVEQASVPLLPVLRYKPSGLRKRQDWERTWALQRQEDAIDARTQLAPTDADFLDIVAAQRLKATEIGDIPVPPKYTPSDFQKSHYWKLRGKLDVPKERWVSFPHCEGMDGQPAIAWAGYDPLQLALAISTYFVDIKERIGGAGDPRLVPLLAALVELLPWLKQWHNHLDPTYNLRMGDYIEGFLQEEARQLEQTPPKIATWQPPKRSHKRRSH